ncbi:hypothetical protein RyT2_07350 [Pseudolactococcus yaeyamensis]
MVKQTLRTHYAHAPKDIERYTTQELREAFLIEEIFTPGVPFA